MDLLTDVMERFQARARVFHTGVLCNSTEFTEGLGHMHLLRGGAMRIETPGRPPQVVDRPSLLLYARPLAHRFVPLGEGADLVCSTLAFDAGAAHPVARTLPPLVVVALDDSPQVGAVIELVFSEASAAAAGRQAVLDRLCEVALIQVLRQLACEGAIRYGVLAGLADPALAKAMTAVHAQPERHWTLQNAAQVAGMSRARFAASFRDVVGSTFGDYLLDWRIGVAQSLLRKGIPVKAAAQRVGYSNASALARAFASRNQPAPGGWQRAASARPGDKASQAAAVQLR
jgi:AraC-like DNA-binding protein